MSDNVRVRIAPSPTGHLHLGTARTALYNYLYAKRHGGKFVLRLEDTDEERSKEEYTQDIVDGLKWLGLSWDEGIDIGGPYAPYRQTEKADHYQQIAHQLIAKGMAYFSYETPEELDVLREGQKAAGEALCYDNRGRDLSKEQEEKYQSEGRIPAIRFKIEESRVVSWNDHIKGEISIDTGTLGGDMVIVKNSGIGLYNFAVVVDDVDMKMTLIIRGEDHITNTAKQILLYEALDYKLPEFAHAPLIFDLERQKLSKRKHGEYVHIDRYRKDGYMPEAMVNYLAQMSWTPPEGKEIFTLEEACDMFDLDKVSKSPAVFDLQKLNWFNSHYLRSLPLSVVTERAKPFLQQFNITEFSQNELEEMVGSVREGLTMLKEIPDAVRFYFGGTIEVPEELRQTVLSTDNARKVLDKTLQNLAQVPWGDHKGCKAVIDAIGKELSIKGKELYWPLRAALSGKTQGPDLGSLISVLGEKRVRARLEAALPLCRSV
ncbi:MAG TPA: glutamate--tRNA ligase [Trichormus sp.]